MGAFTTPITRKDYGLYRTVKVKEKADPYKELMLSIVNCAVEDYCRSAYQLYESCPYELKEIFNYIRKNGEPLDDERIRELYLNMDASQCGYSKCWKEYYKKVFGEKMFKSIDNITKKHLYEFIDARAYVTSEMPDKYLNKNIDIISKLDSQLINTNFKYWLSVKSSFAY